MAAAAANDGPVQEGAVGAGTGATVGKWFGPFRMMKSGVGSYAVEIGSGVRVAALAVVNALGDVIDPKNGRIVAGARQSPHSREFANTAEAMKHLGRQEVYAWQYNAGRGSDECPVKPCGSRRSGSTRDHRDGSRNLSGLHHERR